MCLYTWGKEAFRKECDLFSQTRLEEGKAFIEALRCAKRLPLILMASWKWVC